jgi:uncharacterized protein (DUF952 family)
MSRQKSLILNITTPDKWKAVQRLEAYEDDSLAVQEFIHFSFVHQVVRVAIANFRGRQGIALLVVDPEKLTSPLKL